MSAIKFEKNQIVNEELKEFEGKIKDYLNHKMTGEQLRPRRLLQGVYGQRQPDVQMMRVKVPGGNLDYNQMKCLAELSADYGHHVLHITTRQDIQLHYLKMTDVPDILNRLAQNGMTTREACGNSFRNVTASPYTGLLRDQVFDVTVMVNEVTKFFLRHPDTQALPRKFKIAFSENQSDLGVTGMHDAGGIARIVDGKPGFKLMVGGGLGSQPFPAQVYSEFIEVNQLLPHLLAIARVFNNNGERKKRMKARIKFLVQAWGIEKLKAECAVELEKIKNEGTVFPEIKVDISAKEDYDYSNPYSASKDGDLFWWYLKNVKPTWRKNEYMITLHVPMGDLSPEQALKLIDLLKKSQKNETSDFITLTDDQNLVLKGIISEDREKDFRLLYDELGKLQLNRSGHHDIGDPVSCPGTTTCNLGITSSKGMGEAIRELIGDKWVRDPRFEGATIQMSGCPNSCGRHHLGTLGFFGRSDLLDANTAAPAYNVMIGGRAAANGEIVIAKRCGKILAKRVPEFIQTMVDTFEKNAAQGQLFIDFCEKLSKEQINEIIEKYSLKNHPAESSEKLNFDWGKDVPYVVEFGEGECAS